MANLVRCANARCNRHPAFRFTPYGRQKVQVYACRTHTTRTLFHLLITYGHPILAYRLEGN